MDRRSFYKLSVGAGAALLLHSATNAQQSPSRRKFTIDLCPGMIGVSTNQIDTINVAERYGFESVQPMGEALAALDEAGIKSLNSRLARGKLVWGAAGLPVDFRNSQSAFDADLQKLPRIAAALQVAGVTRVGTWLSPTSDELTYTSNFRQHVTRLSAIAEILNDHGLRFGLEYVGPKTLWSSKRHPFIHTMAETLELIAETGKSNLGVVLDSWHWYTAGENLDTLKQLSNRQIVAVDLNDAPAGIEVDQQVDNQRELPATTGVIDLKTFLQFLVEVGYDGPVRAEPFNKRLNEMDNDPAVELTAKAMRKAISLII